MAALRSHELPRIDGREGAAFCIYWGEVSAETSRPDCDFAVPIVGG